MDKIEVHRSGIEVTGFAVELTTTTRGQRVLPEGRSEAWTATSKMEVIELSIEPLDPALFEVPPGFKKVHRLSDQPPRLFSLKLEGPGIGLNKRYWQYFVELDLRLTSWNGTSRPARGGRREAVHAAGTECDSAGARAVDQR